MIKTYFHGTSFANLESILKDGFNPNSDKIWNVSENGVYFWSPDKLTEAEECEKDWQEETAKQRAFESGQIAMAFSESGNVVVLQVEIDDENIQDDFSCENMAGAVVCFGKIKREQIKKVFVSDDLSLLKGYFMAMVADNDYLGIELTPIQKQVVKVFQKAEFYIDDMNLQLRELTSF